MGAERSGLAAVTRHCGMTLVLQPDPRSLNPGPHFLLSDLGRSSSAHVLRLLLHRVVLDGEVFIGVRFLVHMGVC